MTFDNPLHPPYSTMFHHAEHKLPRQPRTLVLCFDGTADEFDDDNSNVVRFHALLSKGDDEKQMVYYQPGIGTYFKPGVVSPLLRSVASLLDFAVAWYLDEHVCGGYMFLMKNYRPGDKICLFGFSRGAYIARALAGLLNKIGLLPRDNEEQVAFAYKLYKRTDPKGVKLAASFKKTFCRDVKIEFVGVWDTVASVGVLNNRTLPFTTSNDAIKTFRHALALDEHRVKFRPNVWHRPTPVTPDGGKGHTKSPDGPPPPPPSPSPRLVPALFNEVLELFRPPTPLSLDPAHSHAEEANGTTHLPLPSPGASSSTSVRVPDTRGRKRTRAPSLAEEPESPTKGAFTDENASPIGEGGFDGQEPQTLSDSPVLIKPKPGRWPSTVAKVKHIISTQSARVSSSLERAMKADDGDDDDIPVISHEVDATYVEEVEVGATVVGAPKSMEPDVLEVWFPGVHADVGGGSTSNSVKSSLSNITLRWMVREVITSQCGITFDKRAMRHFAVQTSLHISPTRAGNHEKKFDREDAVAPIYDQMKTRRGIFWWLLELVPLTEMWQEKSGHWKRKWGLNLGRGRRIPETDLPPNFHFTVRERMQDPDLKYSPRAIWEHGTEIYVE